MMFPPITFDHRSYYIAGKPAFLYSGEFHYFRVPREDWQRRMELFRQAGGNCIATYIPWLIHEPEEGRFVFGEGQRDLEGFLRVAAEVGLYVIARPGPYQYSELIYAGLPRWLCEGYPQLLAKKLDGSVLYPFSVSYVHPLFLEKTRRWFDQVVPRIAQYTVSRGGPVAFTQIDNELIGIHTWYGSLDYNPEAMGFGNPQGRYPRFLGTRYGSIDRLNVAYGTEYGDFAEVRPAAPGAGAPVARRARDYFDFECANTADYGKILADMLRERGIDTPIVHNAAGPSMNAWFLELCERMGPDFLLGSDHYYTLGQDWGQNNPTPQYAVRVFESLEMLRLLGCPPTVYEMPGGSLSDWPPITPRDAKACYLTNVALGMKGSNFYIFTGGPNVPGTGSTADVYDYGAAIGPFGDVRPLYQAQKQVGLFLKHRPWLAAAERVTDCRFALDMRQHRSDAWWVDVPEVAFTPPAAADFLRKGPLTTAFCAGLSPTLLNLDAEDWPADTALPLVVPCSSVMSSEKQQRLVCFLQTGGRALFTPVLPQFDEDLQPCTVLADFLGTPAMRKNTPGQDVRLTIAGVENVYANGDLFFYENLPPGIEVIGIDEFTGKPVAWQRGQAIVLGLRWFHAMREHERMLSALLSRLGLRQRVACSNPNVWTSLWSDGKKSALFLMNLLSAPQEATVSIDGRDLGMHRLKAMTVKVVEF